MFRYNYYIPEIRSPAYLPTDEYLLYDDEDDIEENIEDFVIIEIKNIENK